MVKQGLPKPLADVGGGCGTLEVHGGKFGKGVFIQVIVVFFGKLFLHGEVVDVYLLANYLFNLKILKTDIDMQRLTLKGI